MKLVSGVNGRNRTKKDARRVFLVRREEYVANVVQRAEAPLVVEVGAKAIVVAQQCLLSSHCRRVEGV
jgi:hypothetical protein